MEPIPTPVSQKILAFRQRRVPTLVWLAAVVASTLLLGGKHGQAEIIGMAQAPNYEISAPATGQIEEVLVEPYETVVAGQVLARMDDVEINARLERSRATIRQLMAALDAERARLTASGTDQASDLRRFQVDEERRRLRTLELRAAIEADEIELSRLSLEKTRAGKLFDEGLLSQSKNDSVRLEHAEASRRHESNKALLGELELEYTAAHERRQRFERELPSTLVEQPTLNPLREAIDIERHRLDEIRHRRRALVLRSPVAGHVSRIPRSQGQTVVRGDTIMAVTENTVTQIVAFLGESNDRPVTHQARVRISSASRPGRSVETTVVRLGQSLEVLPRRLWRTPDAASVGRAVVIATNPTLQLVPGELIRVELP